MLIPYQSELNLSHNKFVTLQRLPKTITKLNVSSNPWKLDEPHYESHRNTYLLSIMADLCTISHLSMSNCGLEEMPKESFKLNFKNLYIVRAIFLTEFIGDSIISRFESRRPLRKPNIRNRRIRFQSGNSLKLTTLSHLTIH